MQHEFIDRGFADTYAAFASASGNEREMRYEWKGTLDALKVNGLYFRDEERSWWHCCIDQVMEVLGTHKPKLLIGASMGGYGALLFAQLTGIEARAYGPQTTISANDWDGRFEHWLRVARAKTKRPDLLDLSLSGDQHHIHFCGRHAQDKRHAERLAVKLFPHDCDNHQVAREIGKKSAVPL